MIDGEATRHLSLKSMKALIAGDGLDLGPRNPVLVVVHGSDIGRVYELDEERVVVGRSATCPIHLNEVGVSRSHALLYRGDDGGLYVSDLGSTNGTFVNGERIERCRLDEGDKVQFGTSTVLRVAFQDRLDEAFHKNQYDAATRDGLTGVLNKRSFMARLDAEVTAAATAVRPVALAMIDIDHFKSINDTFGHDCGDAILRSVAGAMERRIRHGDCLGRYGGEEFGVLMRETDGEHAVTAAERLRVEVESLQTEYDGRVVPATISVGVVAWDGKVRRSGMELLRAADKLLYDAKHGGRNRVCSALL